MSPLAKLLPMVLVSSCAAIGGLNNSRSFQLQALQHQQSRDNNAFGDLPRSMLSGTRPEFEPRARPVKSKGDFSDPFFPLSVSRVTSRTMCFEKTYEPRVGVEGPAEAAQLKAAWRFVVEGVDTLAHAATKPWPALEQASVAEVHALAAGAGWQPARSALELCVPAPTVAATDSALVLTALSTESDARHFVLVWKISDRGE